MNEASSPDSPPAQDLQVLILEPDEHVATEILSALEEAVPGTRARVAASLGEAQHFVVDQKPVLFVLDVDANYDMAQEFIYDLRTSHSKARAIILTAIHLSAHREQISGLGAIHYLEKPFPRADFMTLVEALLLPADKAEGAHFQGTLSDLHVADIIQLKCISGATSMLEFTGPRGEKARVYFENGQVRHATAPGKDGMAAFGEIVDWQGGVISEVPVPRETPHTIDLDWQVLLMEAVRTMDESRGAKAAQGSVGAAPGTGHKILVIDDSVMLLSFVKEILEEEGYDVVTAETGEEGVRLCDVETPDLILLDFVLPDMKGDEVCRRLMSNPTTAKVRVAYVSGFGSDLQAGCSDLPNIIGSLSKPFTSDALINTVRGYIPGELQPDETKPEITPPETTPEPEHPSQSIPIPSMPSEPFGADDGPHPVNPPVVETPETTPNPGPPSQSIPIPSMASDPFGADDGPHPVDELVVETPEEAPYPRMEAAPTTFTPPIANEPPVAPPGTPPAASAARLAMLSNEDNSAASANAYFCGDSSFFSLNRALHTIAAERLTGTLRCFWSRDFVELLARDGRVVIVTTRNPDLYCKEAPVTLPHVPSERMDAARARQTEDGCPLFVTLARENLVLREPGLQLLQRYGQRLFSQLWNDRVRFVFVRHELPDYAAELPSAGDEMDPWALGTLRLLQYEELGEKAMIDPSCVPAYARHGIERAQKLRLTVPEAQFASQLNGNCSIAQISKNLRLGIKFARLTLFRFLVLEIVECWPARLVAKPGSRGGIRDIFVR